MPLIRMIYGKLFPNLLFSLIDIILVVFMTLVVSGYRECLFVGENAFYLHLRYTIHECLGLI